MKLYITCDTIGIKTGGGSVTENELDALKSLGDNVAHLDAEDLTPTKFGMGDSPFLTDYLALDKISELDKNIKIDLAHFYGGPFTQTIRLLKEKGIKTTLTVAAHDRKLSIEEFGNLDMEYPFNHIKDDKLWAIYNGGAREADVVIVPSKLSFDFLRKEGCKQRIEIIPHGCNIPDKVEPIPDKFNVGYLGACILPNSPILSDRGLQKIKDIKIGDKVLTHKGKFKKVSNVMSRQYHGDMIKITPSNIRSPIILTPEHKVLGVKTSPCTNRKSHIYDISTCRPDKKCYFEKDGRQYKNCKYIKGEEPFTNYKTEWIEARNLKNGDFVTYPKADEIEQDIKKIRVLDWIDDILNITTNYDRETKQYDLFGNLIQDTVSMSAPYSRKYANIPVEIELTKDLMRLFGYFIAEGDVYEGRKVRFAFHTKETMYHTDVENIMKNIFGLEAEHYIDEENHSYRIIYSNTILGNLFKNMFQNEFSTKIKKNNRKADLKIIPPEFLNLPLDKLAELIKGEWRGDGSNYAKQINQYNITTTSETLAHQLICILSKFGIFASLKTKKSKIENHEDAYDVIITSGDNEIFERIIGEKLTDSGINNYSQTYLKGKKLFYIQIKDIDIINYNGDVWNLEIEEDNSYVNYIILHNCGPDKGLRYLIEGWSSFNYQDSTLILAGRGTEQLGSFINKYATGGKYHLVGWVENISELYNKISVYVQPSVTEGWGIEVGEAMAYGRPVIVSNGAGAADMVNDNVDGFVVNKRDVKDIANKIQYFKDNPREIERMGKNAREKSLNYDWSIIRQKYINLWKGL